MTHAITSIGFIIAIAIVGFGLTALAVVMIANIGAARQERGKRKLGQESPPPSHPHVPDCANYKRGG